MVSVIFTSVGVVSFQKRCWLTLAGIPDNKPSLENTHR